MDKFLSKPKEEITATIEETAARLNLMPHVEKDFWVCLVIVYGHYYDISDGQKSYYNFCII